MSPWKSIVVTPEHTAALELVRALGIEGARFVDVDEFEALPSKRRACMTNNGGTPAQVTSLLALPEPTPPPEPVDIAVEALREIIDATSSPHRPDDEARQEAERVAHAALVRLDLATEADEPSPDPDPEPQLPTEPGAVVLARVVDGLTFDPPVVLLRDSWGYGGSVWHSGPKIGGRLDHRDADVTDWQPAEVISRELAYDLRHRLEVAHESADERGLTVVADDLHHVLDRLRAATGGGS